MNSEAVQEILSCQGVENLEKLEKTPLLYNIFYYGSTKQMVQLGKVMSRRLKVKDKRKDEMQG